MANNPLITFKAGSCEIDQSSRPYKVVPNSTPGYIYIYMEDNLIHFCWRERSKPINHDDNLDLVILPADCRFLPYNNPSVNESNSTIDGRIFVLKFSSSSQRYIFWLQSKPENASNPSHFSERDLKIGSVVDKILQGDDVNISSEIAAIKNSIDSDKDNGDETMEDVEGHGNFSKHHGGSNGGAGPGATGGDVREEGASAREGGADGGRAASYGLNDTTSIVQNFLHSLQDVQQLKEQKAHGSVFATISDLIPPSMTIPMIDSFYSEQIDNLLKHLPLTILLIAQESGSAEADLADESIKSSEICAEKIIKGLSLELKKTILKQVLRSPHFHQSLASLTMAIRDGGLPSLAEALKIKVPNLGFVTGGTVPLGGSDAVEAFIAGIRTTVEGDS
ncbi:putative 26s proteasome complex ubiquitin receptor subunit rpn13 protein [Golovinomyces cichoracearum]|uniref:Putative 26s proteasome complex ubiquitin receptor subunit rpn13 protein n=1 Tax=Golovinomyces cichoracearum TaxID=62708 RepID=A0A420HJ07_9PEZI|nr:putative 26s proteasome complex ubiquitin receptor subunit rpn13 protein [Golovinomyces cichoracearum]